MQLFLVSEIVVLFTCFLYFLVKALEALGKNDLDGEKFALFIAELLYPVFGFVRLYGKTVIAEQVIEQESVVAKEILELSIAGRVSEPQTRNELNLIYQELTQTPTRITLGKYATFDTGLFLRIANQSVTYLIVLLQFSHEYNSSQMERTPQSPSDDNATHDACNCSVLLNNKTT
ncbi:unnamed protein product [Allacma fusca]|uniref:Uncharacterized protein n=1 Tax=Allacma fusca TaxID=39272 RepID=A0A8J2NZM1_9HEXA|nr:unnamed protein product [Allacma fusca]